MLLTITKSQWLSPSSPLLPIARSTMIVGEYNQSISLLGGYPYLYALPHVYPPLITYHIKYNNFSTSTNVPGLTDSLDFAIDTYSTQYYTSTKSIIYIAQQEYLSIYNMKTKTFIRKWETYLENKYFNFSAPCLASNTEYLFVIGGNRDFQALASVYSFSLSSSKWNSNLPSLNNVRYNGACIVDESTNRLYVIGGYNGNYLSSIERIYIDNIETETWQIIGDLTTAAYGQRAVIYEQTIFIIGGIYFDFGSDAFQYEDVVHIIDTSNDQILLTDTLLYGVVRTAAIIVQGTIYVFGGYNQINGEHNYLDTWMYYPLVTSGPTFNPTSTPTSKPTKVPTKQPSNSPTIKPTSNPSKIPTYSPITKFPTNKPTQSPITYAPTNMPSISPTTKPSKVPTKVPTTQTPAMISTSSPITNIPDISPSPTSVFNPSESPTLFPTKRPTISPITNEHSISPITKSPTTYYPSTSPTAQTMNQMTTKSNYCSDITVEIINLIGISAYDFKINLGLQVFMSNTTYYGIKRNADNYGIDMNLFYLQFKSVSDQLNITETLCVEKENVLDAINFVVENEADDISGYIKNKTIDHFEGINSISTDNMSINVYWGSYVSDKQEPKNVDTDLMHGLSLYITIFILGIFVLFTLFAYLDAKLRKNDYLLPVNIITVSFEILDTILDILFVLYLLFQLVNYGGVELLISTILSFAFIVIPITYSIIDLTREEGKSWLNDDYLKGWLLDHKWKLLALSIITGSSYAAIELVNCGAFGVEIFNMGLNKQQRIKYNTKRLIGVVCLENIPQTIIQIWYLVRFGVALIPILSIIFAFISIILTILTKSTQKSIIKNSDVVKIQFDVKGDDISPKLSRQTNEIKGQMAALFEVRENLIDITKPKFIHRGLRFEIYIFVKDADDKNTDFESVINNVVNNGELVIIIQNRWNLSTSISVENVQCQDTDNIIEFHKSYASVNTNEIDIDE